MSTVTEEGVMEVKNKRGEFTEEKEAIFKEIEKDIGREILEMSTVTEEGVMDVKNNACEMLLQHRVEHKFKSKKVETVLNRLHVAEPVARDNKARPAFVPEAALRRQRENRSKEWRMVRKKRRRPWCPRGRPRGRLNWRREMTTSSTLRRTLTSPIRIINMMLSLKPGRAIMWLTLLIPTSWKSWKSWKPRRRQGKGLGSTIQTSLRLMRLMRRSRT